MSPLQPSRNLAARMGRWSAAHRKTAIFGWLTFVIAALALSFAIPVQLADENDTAVGEAGRANQIIDRAFDLDETGQAEFVLIQSDTKTVDDPAFRATIEETVRELSTFTRVNDLHSPLEAGQEGQIAADRRAVLVSFTPRGDYDEAAGYIDSIVSRVEGVQRAHPDFYVASAGLFDREGARRAPHLPVRAGRTDRDPADAHHPAAGPRLADGGAGPGGARRDRGPRHHRPGHAAQPVHPHHRWGQRGDPADRPRGGRRLRALLHAPRARRASSGTQRGRRPRGGRRHIGSRGPRLRLHGHDRDGRHVPLGQQVLHVLRDRDDDGRLRRLDRLADGPSGDPVGARRPGREGADPVPRAASA